MARFHKVARASELPPGTGRKIEVEGRAVALFNDGGEIRAIEERCPHRGGPLSEGTLQDGKVTCPWHGWIFDVRTGGRAGFPEGRGGVSTYPVKVEGDDVLVEL